MTVKYVVSVGYSFFNLSAGLVPATFIVFRITIPTLSRLINCSLTNTSDTFASEGSARRSIPATSL